MWALAVPLMLLVLGAICYVGLSQPRVLTLSIDARTETVAVQLADCSTPQQLVLPPGRFAFLDDAAAERGDDPLRIVEMRTPVLLMAHGNGRLIFDQADRRHFRLRASVPESKGGAQPASFEMKGKGSAFPAGLQAFTYEMAGDDRSGRVAAHILHYPLTGEYVIGRVPGEVAADDAIEEMESTPSLLSATVRGHDLAWVSNSRLEIFSEQAGPGDEILTDPTQGIDMPCKDAATGVISVDPRSSMASPEGFFEFGVIAHAHRAELLIRRGAEAKVIVGVSQLEAVAMQTVWKFFWALLIATLGLIGTVIGLHKELIGPPADAEKEKKG